YRPDIDGLRGIAIILVVVFHSFPAVMPGGFVGVDVFFVISGFLIANIIFEGLERRAFSCRRFYANRICRLFPALIAVLSLCLAAGSVLLLPDEFKSRGKDVAGSAVYITNFLLVGDIGYFNVNAELKPLMHL